MEASAVGQMQDRNWLRDLIGCRAGNAALVCAATLPLLISSAALAYDAVQLAIWTHRLQHAAEAGAAAGARALAAGEPLEAAVGRAVDRDPRLHIVARPTIRVAPITASADDRRQTVRVRIKSQRELPFLGALMETLPTRIAEATAVVPHLRPSAA